MGVISDTLTMLRLIPAGLALIRHLKLSKDANAGNWFVDVRSSKKITKFHNALARLGPSYVKFGQLLATRPDIVGTNLANALLGLQDSVPPFSTKEAKKAIENSFAEKIENLYANFSLTPVASASIAQVHQAETSVVENDNTIECNKVAVKVLRPGIEKKFARDIKNFYALARNLERIIPAARRLRPTAIVKTLERSALLEIDLRLEGAAISETAEIFAENDQIILPTVDWKRSSRRVLTMEWLEGISIGNKAALQEANFDLSKLAEQLIQAFVYQALNAGFFHADMHQGNFLVLRNSSGNQSIAMLDFGITGRISITERRYLAGILHGFITGEYYKIAEIHLHSGYVSSEYSVPEFAQALRSIGEPIRGLPANEISMGNLLSQLFEVTRLFGMKTQPQLLLLQKTMVAVEGVARSLDSNLNIWTASEPVVKKWAEQQTGAQERLREVAENAATLGRLVSEAIPLADQLRNRIGEIGVTPSQQADETTPSNRENSSNPVNWLSLLLSSIALGTSLWLWLK